MENHRKTESKSGKHPNSLANLKPFKPGAEWTGNAGGVPKGTIFVTDRVRRKLADRSYDNKFEQIADNLINRAVTKDNALVNLLDRTEGKVPDKKEHSGTIKLVVEYRDKPIDEDVDDSQVNI